MSEKEMQVKFGKWMRESYNGPSAAFELKLCKGNNALPFAAFEPQQPVSLLKAKHEFIFKKLSDADRTLKPFDCFVLVKTDAWVIAGWHHMGKGIATYWIDIDAFLAEQAASTRKSITEKRAVEIASKHFILT